MNGQEEIWHKDPKNWRILGIYYNKDDKRIFVEKRIKWMGFTLNFANPKSYFAILFIFSFFGFILYMLSLNR